MRSARPTEAEASAPEPRRNDTAPDISPDTSADLFPDTLPPVVSAVWPKHGTRKADALEALIAGPQNQCDYAPGWRLAAYVQALEYDGWRIRSRLFKHPRCKALIAEYTLDRQDPATAAALRTRREAQSGFFRPEVAGWLVLLTPAAAAVLALLARWAA